MIIGLAASNLAMFDAESTACTRASDESHRKYKQKHEQDAENGERANVHYMHVLLTFRGLVSFLCLCGKWVHVVYT